MRLYVKLGEDSTFDKGAHLVQSIVAYHTSPNEQNGRVLLRYYRDKLRIYMRQLREVRQSAHPSDSQICELYAEIMCPYWRIDIRKIRQAFEMLAEAISFAWFPHVHNYTSKFDNVYPLLGRGFHYYNSYLYALVNGVHLAGMPSLRPLCGRKCPSSTLTNQMETTRNSPRAFYAHDLGHIQEMEFMGIMKKKNLRQINEIRMDILAFESSDDPREKELMIFVLWAICHEICWSIAKLQRKVQKDAKKTIMEILSSQIDHNWMNFSNGIIHHDHVVWHAEQHRYYDALVSNNLSFFKMDTYNEKIGVYVANFVYGIRLLFQKIEK